MKTIGLIGGMSWESSKAYYEYINIMIKAELGGSHSAKVILTSVDFAEIEKHFFDSNWDAIGKLMAKEAENLEKAGAELILLCTNTIHLVSNYITDAINVPFLHIAEATGAAVKVKQLSKIALLGTRFTMEKDFYTKILSENYGLDIMIPNDRDRGILHDIIFNELVKGEFTEASKQKYIEIIHSLEQEGAEGVIFGCTEIPLLVADTDVAIPTFNTTEIHAQQAVNFALKK